MYDFDEIISREGTQSMKFGLIESVYPYARKDSIPLWIADMDFSVAPEILQAIKDRCDKKILGYTKFLDVSYYQIVVAYFQRHFDWAIDPATIVFSNGVIPAVRVLIQKLSKPGDGVIVHTPVYSPFKYAIIENGRLMVESPLIKDKNNHYSIDFADFEKKCADPHNTVCIICSPHNPTGRVWTKEELIQMHDICRRHNVEIITDEIHSDLTRKNIKHTSFARLFPDDKKLYVCTAPSKMFNLAGMHFSNIIITDKSMRDWWYATQPSGHPGPLSLEACIAAYTKCDQWRAEVKEYIDGNFNYIAQFIKTNMPKARFNVPDATYLAWIDVSGYGYSDDEIMLRTQKGGVLVEGAKDFNANAEGFIRINVASPRSVIAEAMKRLKDSLE